MKALAAIFVFFCFFPYVALIGLSTDTQPNALTIGAILLVLMKDKKVTPTIVITWVLFGLSLFLILNNKLSTFDYVKNVLNYLSLALVTTTSYILFKRQEIRIPFKVFFGILLVYLFFGLGQQYLSPNFGSIFLANMRGVMINGRGVVSLTPEPAFYGSICLFFMIFSVLNYSKKQNYIAIPLLLAQMIILSKSATSVAILSLSLIIFTVIQILRLRVKYIAYTAVILAILIPTFNSQLNELESTRAGKLAADFLRDPIQVTQVDLSVGVRLTGAVVPFLNAKYNNFRPMGLGHYKQFLSDLYVSGKCRKFLNPDIINEKDRVGGSMNMVLYQLGFLGLLFPVAIFLAFKARLRESKYLISCILFCCILFTQLQLMHSFIGFLLGFVMYKSRTDSAPATS